MSINYSNDSGFFSQRNYDGPIVMTIEQVGPSKLSLLYSDPVTDLQLFRIPHRKIQSKEIGEIVGDSPAVYILVGSEPKRGVFNVYVGETGGTAQRVMVQAGAEKNNFANCLYVLTSRSNQFNKVHMKFFEGLLTDLIRRQPAFEVRNCADAMYVPSAYDASLVERGYYIAMKLLVASGFPFPPEVFVDALTTHELVNRRKTHEDRCAATRLARVANYIEPNVVLKFNAKKTKVPDVVGYGILEDNGNFTILPGSVPQNVAHAIKENTKLPTEFNHEGDIVHGTLVEPATFLSVFVATTELTSRQFTKAETLWLPTDEYELDELTEDPDDLNDEVTQ